MKSKKSLENFGKYLREISVIVLGVAITLYASNWLNVSNEKRDISLYLNDIQLELEENVIQMEGILKSLQPEIRYANYLRMTNREFINKDTINAYIYVAYNFEIYAELKTTAFEMFKNSGTMRLMEDKKLLTALWDAYQRLNITSKALDRSYQMKTDFLIKEFPLFLAGNLSEIPMYSYYIMGVPIIIESLLKHNVKNAKEMIERLENAKR